MVDPVFSDVKSYPFFYSTVPTYTEFVKPIGALLEHFDWQVIGVVVQRDRFHFVQTVEALSDFLSKKNGEYRISTTRPLMHHIHHEGGSSQNSARIFIAMVEEKFAADMLCAAFKNGLTGSEFVWILLGDYVEGWWRSLRVLDCTEQEMLMSVESTLILTNSVQVSKTLNSIRLQKQSVFWKDFRIHLNTNTDLDFRKEYAFRVLQAYDAVWSIANALKITLTKNQHLGNIKGENGSSKHLGHFDSTDQVKAFNEAMNKNMKNFNLRAYRQTLSSPRNPTVHNLWLHPSFKCRVEQ